MQTNGDNKWILTFISTTSHEIATFRGIACGMSEADLLSAYDSDLEYAETCADNETPTAQYNYVYGYAPAEYNTCKHIVFLLNTV